MTLSGFRIGSTGRIEPAFPMTIIFGPGGTGTWHSEDPLGFIPDYNPYRYAANQPTAFADPSGLQHPSRKGPYGNVHPNSTTNDPFAWHRQLWGPGSPRPVSAAIYSVARPIHDNILMPPVNSVVNTAIFGYDVVNAVYDPYYQPIDEDLRNYLNCPTDRTALLAWAGTTGDALVTASIFTPRLDPTRFGPFRRRSPVSQPNPGALHLGEVGDGFLADVQAHAVPRNGFYDFAAHGNPLAIEIPGPEGGTMFLSANEAAVYLRAMPDYAGGPVRAIGCELGKLPDGFASQLSKELGTLVIAPDTLVFAGQPGALVPGRNAAGLHRPIRVPDDGLLLADGFLDNGVVFPLSPPRGKWLSFKSEPINPADLN